MGVISQLAVILRMRGRSMVAILATCGFFSCAGLRAATSGAVNGPHTLSTDRLPEIFSPVEALPGGGYVAFGGRYMALSEGSFLRWKLKPIPRKAGTDFPPGVRWLGGGVHAVFFYQARSIGEKPWLGPGTENGLVSVGPGPKFQFVRPLWQVGPAAFLNSRVGIFVISGNLVLTFDSGQHLHPAPHVRGLDVLALRWLPGHELATIEFGRPAPSIVKFKLAGDGGLRRVWGTVVPEIADGKILKKPWPIAYREGGVQFVGASAKVLWVASDKNLYAVDSSSGKTVAIIPGRRLAYPSKKRLRDIPAFPALGGHAGPGGRSGLGLPSWAWSGRLVTQVIGSHIFAYDQSPSANSSGPPRMPTINVWTVKGATVDFDFAFSGEPPDQYLKTKQGLFAIHFGGPIQRISFRKKAVGPVELRVRVPGPGRWDPQPPVPRRLGARFVALFGKNSPLPPRVQFQIMKRAQRKFFFTRDRFKYMVDQAQVYLKASAAIKSNPSNK